MARLFTDELAEFVRNNVKGLSNQRLADLINEKFDLNISRQQIRTWKKNRGLSSGLTGQFEKGHVPINKGTKGMFNVGGNKTSFKPGHKPHNYKPVGYERIDRDGYVLVKVQDDGPWHKRWRHKHKVLWEKENGPVPKGHKLLFADGNKQNICLDNLILITDAQLARLNQNDLINNDADLTRTGIIVADLISKISERNRSQKEG